MAARCAHAASLTPEGLRRLGAPDPRGGEPACTCDQGVLALGQVAERDRDFASPQIPPLICQFGANLSQLSHRNEDAR